MAKKLQLPDQLAIVSANDTVVLTPHELTMGNTVLTPSSVTCDNLHVNGEAEFSSIRIGDPVFGNDAASKGYVDSLVGQYGGSLNLFLNNSESSAGYQELSPVITAAETSSIAVEITGMTEQLVASFRTTPLKLDKLPAGVWVANLNGQTTNGSAEVSYVMRIYKYSGDTETAIGLAAQSTSINSTSIGDYYCNLVVPETELALTDRLVVKIFVLKTEASLLNPTITTWFEGAYYSFVSSSLNAGTTLLSSNNVWTGTNDFQLGVKSSSVDSATTLALGTTSSGTTVGNASNPTTINAAQLTIAAESSLDIGKTGVETSLLGDVDIPTKLTLGNGALSLYGASSGSFGTYDNTANRTFASNFPNPNTNFTLTLTGASTTQRTLTLPPVKDGYSITILNLSSGIWNLNTTSPDLMYGGNAWINGSNSIGLAVNRSVTLQQVNSAYYFVSESITNTDIGVLRIWGRNDANQNVNITGNASYKTITTGSYSFSDYFGFTSVMIFRMTGVFASPTFTLFTGATIGTNTGGNTFMIRNDTTGILTINCSGVDGIFINSSSTAQATFQVGINKTVIFQTIRLVGWFVVAYDGDDGDWVGTATSALNMNGNNITSDSSLAVGKTGVATSLIGNVDIPTSLTLGNGALSLYGASSGSFGSYDGSLSSYTFANDFPNPNSNFTLLLTTASAGRTITLPPVKNGNTINIVNISSQTYTIRTTGSEMIYGGFVLGGNTQFNLHNVKSVVLQQVNSAYYIVSESISNTRITGRSENLQGVTLCGIPGYISNTTGASTLNYGNLLPVTIYRMTGTYASPTFTLLATTLNTLQGGYTIMIRNDTTGVLTVQSDGVPCILTNTSSTAVSTFSVAVNKTLILQTFYSRGYCVVAYDGNWVGTATSALDMGSNAITGTSMDSATTLTLGGSNATDVTVGRTGATTANITGTTINLSGAVKASNIDTATTTTVANILTAAARTAATNMLTSTSNNTFTLGGRDALTGMTLNLEGIAANFNSTVNNFTNAIRGIGSTLLVSTPLQPTYDYSATTGTQPTAIGYQIKAQKTSLQNVSVNTSTALTELTFEITKGVWYVSAQIQFIINNESAQTVPSIALQLGSGSSGNTNSNIAIHTLTNVTFGNSPETGNQGVVTFGAMFSTIESTFISASVVCLNATTEIPLQFATSNKLSATRVA